MDENVNPVPVVEDFKSPEPQKATKPVSPLSEVFEKNGSPVSDHNKSSGDDSPDTSSLSDISIEHPRQNPFEKHILAGLESSFCKSDSSLVEVKEDHTEEFWDIDQKSNLFPVDIENSPTSHQNEIKVGARKERRAQEAITKYFQRATIVPTPSPVREGELSLDSPQSTRPKRRLSSGVLSVGRKLDLTFLSSDEELGAPSPTNLVVPFDPFKISHNVPSRDNSPPRFKTPSPPFRCDSSGHLNVSSPFPETPGVSPIFHGVHPRIRKSNESTDCDDNLPRSLKFPRMSDE